MADRLNNPDNPPYGERGDFRRITITLRLRRTEAPSRIDPAKDRWNRMGIFRLCSGRSSWIFETVQISGRATDFPSTASDCGGGRERSARGKSPRDLMKTFRDRGKKR